MEKHKLIIELTEPLDAKEFNHLCGFLEGAEGIQNKYSTINEESVPAETLVRQGDVQPMQTADLKEPETPIGDFILNFKCNNEVLSGSEGIFYHYADVCSMLKAYKQKEHKCAGCDAIIYHQSYCNNCERLWQS